MTGDLCTVLGKKYESYLCIVNNKEIFEVCKLGDSCTIKTYVCYSE